MCGAVHYEIASPPVRTTICYCRFCQRASGGAQVILPVLARADFAFVTGDPATSTHVSEGSGKELNLRFCGDCGTRVAIEFERFPEMIGLYAGTLEDPSIVPLGPESAKQIFVSSARPGTVLWAGLPTYWNHAAAPDGTPEKAVTLARPMPVEEVRFD
nr:GFA family protein [Sulfitobacter aestuariivivens]